MAVEFTAAVGALMRLKRLFARTIKPARDALTFALSALLLAASPAWADDPPPLTIGVPGPVILNESGQPYTSGNGTTTTQLQAVVVSSERGLNIPFTNLTGVDPNYFLPTQIVYQVVANAPQFLTVGNSTGRYEFETGSASLPIIDSQFPNETFSDSRAYRLFETNTINTVNVGGGVTATIRAGGVERASATAASAADAQSQALGQLRALNLPGRRLPAIVTSSGVVESVSESRVSAITARDTYVATIVTFGPEQIVIGARGRCEQFVTNCQGGLTYAVGDDETNYNTYLLEDVYVTNTITRTITSSGEIVLDIPFAAYGRVHPAAQTMAFEQSGAFLTRALHSGNARPTAPLGDAQQRWSVFLEGARRSSDFDADGAVAASDGDFTGARGGFTFAATPALTLGAIGESGDWSWALHDAVLPEHADDAQTWRFGGFASWRPQSWRIALAGFGGQARVRSLASSSLGGGTSTALYDADVYGAGAEIGYAIPVQGLTVTPNVGVDWLGWRAPAFEETGGLAPLSVASASRDQKRFHFGVSADYEAARWNIGGYVRGTYVDGDRTGLVIASDGVSAPGSFVIEGPASDRRQAEIGAHIDYAPRPDVVLSLSGDARGGEQSQSYGLQWGLRIAL